MCVSEGKRESGKKDDVESRSTTRTEMRRKKKRETKKKVLEGNRNMIHEKSQNELM